MPRLPMPASPVLAATGLLALGLVAYRLFSGALSVPSAAVRVGVLVVVLLIADRIVMPVARSLVGPASRD